MVRTAFVLVLLAALAGAAPATAASAHWPFWLRKPETHGSRKTPGDYTHARGSYRYHSRERHGLLSFLRARQPSETVARHRSRPAGSAPRRARPMSF